jgi:hypothetical protein
VKRLSVKLRKQRDVEHYINLANLIAKARHLAVYFLAMVHELNQS